jgi:hypothetical protein
MKYFSWLAALAICLLCVNARPVKRSPLNIYKADNQNIKYVGRVDFSNPQKPRFWAPGVYIQAKFEGTSLEITFNDENSPGINHNYLEIAIDNNMPIRIQADSKFNKVEAASHLKNGVHTVTICKDTEAGIGYIEFLGLACEKLLPLNLPAHKIEFIGNSITCGSGIDQSTVKCGTGLWYDQHNAYLSYGPQVARALNAQWHLTAVSGIGLIHSCCNLPVTMPQVFDKTALRDDTLQWDFKKYVPDVVTVCLGQNDGIQDSLAFCSAYVSFIHKIRAVYPKADIICLGSPMASDQLSPVLKKYILAAVRYLNRNGDKKVAHFFFARSYNDGCFGHPDMAQHRIIAQQLLGYIKELEKW